ncbi:MAG: FimV/HubP family polar landmark protein [Pseudoxanthomonas suwonensis]|nr:FimV/HubP family polar landmark protein [Pseudoxanthomonas suwonensis]
MRNIAFGLLLALMSLPAWALGLGPIQVKSQPGQPLLAEIPIISSDPEELRGLQARLASPEVFRRIGLQAPEGIISDLQFTLAIDDDGQPLIRVTTPGPVQQPALTFLVEVDWGQGRLVREYTALVDAPRTMQSPAAPVVEAPEPSLPAVVGRPDSPVTATPEAAPDQAPAAATTPTPAPATPTPRVARPAPVPRPVAADADGHRVERGQTLSGIASRHRGEASLNQMMVALLEANPEAFIDGDINRVRAGAVLRLPSREERAAVDQTRATALVDAQVERWRAARRARLASAGTAAAAASPAGPAAATGNAATVVAASGARLEIAPPGADDGARGGTQSGLQAGGEGDMLRQELQETLAARDSEVAELKARVAELEQLSRDQGQLLELKDNQLAQVQQNVAQQDAGNATAGIWWWALPLLVLVGVIAWLFARRRPAAAPASGHIGRGAPATPAGNADVRRAMPDAPAVAAAGPSATATSVPSAAPAPASVVEQPAVANDAEPVTRDGIDADDHALLPGWGAERMVAAAPAPEPTPPPLPISSGPAWHAGPASADTVAPLNPAPAGSDRIELARAYLDLGDRQTARSLLQEVVDGGNPQAAEDARSMLERLG